MSDFCDAAAAISDTVPDMLYTRSDCDYESHLYSFFSFFKGVGMRGIGSFVRGGHVEIIKRSCCEMML